MSSNQKITLLNNVSAAGAGSAFQWDGGPAVVMAWWDAASGTVLTLEVSPDGGSHWTALSGGTRSAPGSDHFSLTTSGGGEGAMSAVNLPPMMIRGHVFGSNPTNLSMTIEGYDEALDVPNAN